MLLRAGRGGGIPGSWDTLPCPALQRNVPIPTPEYAVLCSDAQPPVEQTASAGASFDLHVAGGCDGYSNGYSNGYNGSRRLRAERCGLEADGSDQV